MYIIPKPKREIRLQIAKLSYTNFNNSKVLMNLCSNSKFVE